MMKLMTIKLRVTGGAQRAQAEEDCCIQRYGVIGVYLNIWGSRGYTHLKSPVSQR